MSNGRTRLYVQKARWATSWHAKTLELRWTDGEGFEVDEKAEVTDADLTAKLLAAIGEHPGTGWTNVEKATPGVNADRRRRLRDRLLADRVIINVVRENGVDVALDHCRQGRQTHLYHADNPTIRQLRPDPDEVGTKSSSAGVRADQNNFVPSSALKEDEGRDEVFRGAPSQLPMDAPEADQ